MLEKNNIKNRKKPKRETPLEILNAWDSYFSNRDDTSKMKLIKYYHFLVHNITRPFWAKKPFILDMDDLIQAGRLGLIQAIERYRNDTDASFETFAQLRVRGSILDEINSLDWTPRNMRRMIREVIAAESKLIAHGDEPSIENLSKETKYSHEEVKLAKQSAQRTFVLPIDQDALREHETFTSNDQQGMNSPLDGTQNNNEGLDFRIAIMKELTEEEGQVIYLRFFCCESVSHTAKILNMTSSKVSVVQKRALDKLRKIMDFKES